MVWNPEKEWEHLELILAEVYLVLSSMMNAATAALTNAAAPMYSEQILAYSATSGLLTAVTGVYVEMFLALPLANWYYNRVNPGIEKLRAKLFKKASEEA